jgi:hypothetical protein
MAPGERPAPAEAWAGTQSLAHGGAEDAGAADDPCRWSHPLGGRPTLAEVFRRYGSAYLEKYGDAVPAAHRKVMHAIQHCRDGTLGHAVYRCDGCGFRCHGRSPARRTVRRARRDAAAAWRTVETAMTHNE